MAPDETKDPATSLSIILKGEYGLEDGTVEEVIKRYFQINPMSDITDAKTLKQWAEAEAEEIYSNRRYWD